MVSQIVSQIDWNKYQSPACCKAGNIKEEIIFTAFGLPSKAFTMTNTQKVEFWWYDIIG